MSIRTRKPKRQLPKGVYLSPEGTYRTRIYRNYEHFSAGTFATLDEAALAVKELDVLLQQYEI